MCSSLPEAAVPCVSVQTNQLQIPGPSGQTQVDNAGAINEVAMALLRTGTGTSYQTTHTNPFTYLMRKVASSHRPTLSAAR